jgi:hypothetical protein
MTLRLAVLALLVLAPLPCAAQVELSAPAAFAYGAGEPATSAADGVAVAFRGRDSAALRVHQQVGAEWRTLCTTPCVMHLSVGRYRLGLSAGHEVPRGASAVRITRPTGFEARIDARDGEHAGGVVMAVLGPCVLGAGITGIVVGISALGGGGFDALGGVFGVLFGAIGTAGGLALLVAGIALATSGPGAELRPEPLVLSADVLR